MSEAMDGRVRAGRRILSNAGYPARALCAGREIRGALLFGYFLLGKQEKVTRAPQGHESV